MRLPEFVSLVAEMGVREVHLQRLVFDDDGLAYAEGSLFERTRAEEQAAIAAAEAVGREPGVSLDASGATEPGMSLRNTDGGQPWPMCRRPWSLMYFTACGRILPCCIDSFSAGGYENYTLCDASQQTLREVWNGNAYRSFRTGLLGDVPPKPCQECGRRWSL